MHGERSSINAGDLDRVLTIQALSLAAADTRGHPVRTWTDTVANIYGKMETPTGKKLEMARQLVPDATHLITIRWRTLDEENHRIAYYAPATTLNGAITANATSVTVTSSLLIPKNAVLVIGSEKMQVTGPVVGDTAFISGNVLTVTRGYESSTAATHADGVIVRKRRIFNIGNGEDVEERHVALMLTCTEVKGTTG